MFKPSYPALNQSEMIFKTTSYQQSIIDTHTHICDPVFDDDRGEVLKRARDVGVAAIIAVSENLPDSRRNLELAMEHPILRPAAGLYPTVLDLRQAEAMIDFIRNEQTRLFAIGEVGLDFWVVKDDKDRERQRRIFSRFIKLSAELDMVLNVHSRSAGRHVIDMLLNRNAKKVQLHAFDGKASTALPAVEAGYFFSIPPSIIRSRQKQKLVKQLPLSHLLIETDSPVLSPTPGQRNEPANAILVTDIVAEIKNVSKETVMEAAFQNTCRLYGDLKL